MDMDRKPLFYLSLFTALTAFTFTYCATSHFQIPLPRYYPTLNQWSMIRDPALPSIGWYSQTITSLCVGGVIGRIVHLAGARSQLVNEPAIFAQIAGWIAVISAVLMMLYVFQHEWRYWMVKQ